MGGLTGMDPLEGSAACPRPSVPRGGPEGGRDWRTLDQSQGWETLPFSAEQFLLYPHWWICELVRVFQASSTPLDPKSSEGGISQILGLTLRHPELSVAFAYLFTLYGTC